MATHRTKATKSNRQLVTVETNSLCPAWSRDLIRVCRNVARFAVTDALEHKSERKSSVCLGLNFADESLLRDLNRNYRNKDCSTDILSFQWVYTDHDYLYLGDIFFSWQDVLKYSQEHDLDLDYRMTHLTIHGALHLLGYDHCDDAKAKVMEDLETSFMQKMGLDDPYE